MTIADGEIIGRTYRVERLLGEGGMARVYLVTHTRMPKRFALKLIAISGGSGKAKGDFIARFRQEATVLARLHHPHIVDVVDYDETPDGMPFLVMEYLEGEDLAHFLSRTNVLQQDVALAIAYQVGTALQAAHDAGVVHRDLKPGNIFLSRNGPFPNFVKVLDFGIAKLLREDGHVKTRPMALMGTPAYMSPEQAKGAADQLDARSDQFALAVIIYEMLTGRRPFCLNPDETPLAILAHIVSHEPPQLPIPRIGEVLARAMSKEPEKRFASIKEFLAALGARRAFSAVATPPSTLNSSHGELEHSRSSRFDRRRMVPALGVGILASGLAIAGAFWASNRSSLTATGAIRGPQAGLRAAEPSTPATLNKGTEVQPVAPMDRAQDVQDSKTKEAEAPPSPDKPVAEDETAAVKPPTTKPTKRVAPTTLAHRPAEALSAPFQVSVSGADGAARNLIQKCCEKELRYLSEVPKSYRVLLQRSGALHIIEAPEAVRQTDLAKCLRDAFAKQQPPPEVTVMVKGGR